VNRTKIWSKENVYSWELPAALDPQVIDELARQTCVSRETATILLQRAQGDLFRARSFWEAGCSLPDVLELPGIRNAVERIVGSRSSSGRKEQIVIYSDFDADGVTSALILKEALDYIGLDAQVYFPSRFEDGYGFHPHLVEKLCEEGATLIITADCGITGFGACAKARALGCDVIITDHHLTGPELPEALVVLNPHLNSWASFQLQNLSGAGVAYLLARALFLSTGILCRVPDTWGHDLLTLSIAGDGQPLTGLNRLWVQSGLKAIEETTRPGMLAMLLVSGIFRMVGSSEICDRDRGYCNVSSGTLQVDSGYQNFSFRRRALTFERDIVFGLVPRINVAGRLAHAKYAYKVLAEKDFSKAFGLAKFLDELNAERKSMEDKMLKECLQDLENVASLDFPFNFNNLDRAEDALEEEGNKPEKPFCSYALCAHRTNWHEGVIGITCSKIKEMYYRPVVLVAGGGETLKGSARGIPGFDVYQALLRCRDLLENFGGHEGAGGFSVHRDKVEKFFAMFKKVSEELLQETTLRPCIKLDDVVAFTKLDDAYLDSLLALEPFGQGNPVPLISSFSCAIREVRLLGRFGNHLELYLASSQKDCVRRFLWFGNGEKAWDISWWGTCDVVFTPVRSRYAGREKVSLLIKDICPAWNLRGRGYADLVNNLPKSRPLILYTWSHRAARSMYVSLLKAGRKSSLHLKNFWGAMAHEARRTLKQPGGVVVSTAPWQLFLPIHRKPGSGQPYTRLDSEPKLILVHPPIRNRDWVEIESLLENTRVQYSVNEQWFQDSWSWLNWTYPQKEYMEKVWKFFKRNAYKGRLLPWDIGRKWEELLIFVGSGHYSCKDSSGAYEKALVFLESSLNILEDLGMISYNDSRKIPEYVLYEPQGQVSLLDSPSFMRGKRMRENAVDAWEKYDFRIRRGEVWRKV